MTTPYSTTESTIGLDEGQGLFVYGVVPASRELPSDLVGLDDAPVLTIPYGQVAAVVSVIDLERRPGRRAHLIAYDTVVGHIAQGGVVAPVRFGTALPDEGAVVTDLLGTQERPLLELLGYLEGRQQFNLRATYVDEVVLREIVETEPTIRELRNRTKGVPGEVAYADRVRLGELVTRSLEARGDDDAADLMDALAAYIVEAVVRSGRGPESVLDVALLVDADRVEALEERLEQLAETVHERMRLRLVGPIAPFDFVGRL